jgi:hypothetical protein
MKKNVEVHSPFRVKGYYIGPPIKFSKKLVDKSAIKSRIGDPPGNIVQKA